MLFLRWGLDFLWRLRETGLGGGGDRSGGGGGDSVHKPFTHPSCNTCDKHTLSCLTVTTKTPSFYRSQSYL